MKEAGKMSYKVFVSSTHKDLEVAREVANRLENLGLKVYSVERNAVGGDNILTKAKQSMSNADEVLLIVTNNSVNSQGLASEMGLAFSLNKHITPVVKGVKKNELPPLLRHMDYVKYEELSKYLSKVAKRANAA
jgi:hypothetical protein